MGRYLGAGTLFSLSCSRILLRILPWILSWILPWILPWILSWILPWIPLGALGAAAAARATQYGQVR